jgi:hypothetical protein
MPFSSHNPKQIYFQHDITVNVDIDHVLRRGLSDFSPVSCLCSVYSLEGGNCGMHAKSGVLCSNFLMPEQIRHIFLSKQVTKI